MANTDRNRNTNTAEDTMKFTRLTIPALSLAATTLLVAQGQPEPFPTPAPPTTPVPPAPGIPAVPAPVPPVPLPPVTPPPIAVPVPPAPVVPAVPAPAAVPPLATPAAPAAPAPAGGAAPVQPVSDPSIGVGLVNGTRVSARGRATIFSSLVFQFNKNEPVNICLLYTSPSPRDATLSRMPSSA